MNQTYYDFDDLACDINYRWLQPPQIAYFVTTTDGAGNVNTTPVTLGTLVSAALPRGDKPSEYFFTFSLGKVHLKDEGNEIGVRHGFINLRATDECVISYIGHSLVHESAIAGLPIPRGISEIDVAGLTPLPSQKVTPPGIAECPVNMEAKIVSSQPIGTYYELYLAQIVAASVDSRYVDADTGLGVLAIDPVFEVAIDRDPPKSDDARLSFGRLDPAKIERTGDGMGCVGDWIGSFEKWIDGERKRGRIGDSVASELLSLNREWQRNRDPVENAEVKSELTERLRTLCAREPGRRSHG